MVDLVTKLVVKRNKTTELRSGQVYTYLQELQIWVSENLKDKTVGGCYRIGRTDNPERHR